MDDILALLCTPKENILIDPSSIPGLTDEERGILSMCIATKGKNKGRLRASKPKVVYMKVIAPPDEFHRNAREVDDPTYESGAAAYVWRMLAFYTSREHRHQCLPMTADFDLPYWGWDEDRHEQKRTMVKWLNELVDKVLAHTGIPRGSGADRWGRALLGR